MRRLRPSPRGRAALRILAGDFNATLDHRELRRVLDLGYADAADATGDGLVMTWPVRPAADHRAVIAELVLPRAG